MVPGLSCLIKRISRQNKRLKHFDRIGGVIMPLADRLTHAQPCVIVCFGVCAIIAVAVFGDGFLVTAIRIHSRWLSFQLNNQLFENVTFEHLVDEKPAISRKFTRNIRLMFSFVRPSIQL